MLSARSNIMKQMFDNDFADIKDIIEELEKDNDVNETNKNLTVINWDDSELEGKTLEEKEFICKYRTFLQDIFNEYQIRSVHILSHVTKDADATNADEATMQNNLSNEYASLLINMFIKCGNWGYNEASNYVSSNYKMEINKFEDTYIDTINNYKKQLEQIEEYTKELEELKNRIKIAEEENETLTKHIEELTTEKETITTTNTTLSEELTALKNKKFLGIFKLNS